MMIHWLRKHHILFTYLFSIIAIFLSITVVIPLRAATSTVLPQVETQPVTHSGDSADDPAIWIHPTDPSLSLIIGTDKASGGGLYTYNLDGTQQQFVNIGKVNNVDLRYNFLLNGERTAIVTASDQSNNAIAIYRVNPVIRQLENVAARTVKAGMTVYGECMYYSSKTGKYYAFLTKSPYVGEDKGEVRQYELFETQGKVDARLVRTFFVGSDSEGCVADDELGYLYITQAKGGIWKYQAEPSGGDTRTLVAGVFSTVLEKEPEGISIYYTSAGTGYLIVSEQCCSSRYVIFRREGNNEFVAHFKVDANPALGIDRANGTDGLDVTNFPLNSTFSKGMLVVHDGDNAGSSYTNFKLIRWEDLSLVANPALSIDTNFDPRLMGASSPSNQPTPQPTIKPTTAPTTQPTIAPTIKPTGSPTIQPTDQPTTQPTIQPTTSPTTSPIAPTTQPTLPPTVDPDPPKVPGAGAQQIWLPLIQQ